MTLELRQRLYDELSQLTLIDPHTHIDPRNPASETLADILGYHYYTELAHSAGMPRAAIEEQDDLPRDKVRRLMDNLGPLDNTIQASWLLEMARELFGFQGDRLTSDNWEAVYDAASQKMSQGDWADQVLRQSKLEAVFLTNDFDDALEGFDTQVYIPCLRTDDLVFHLAKESVRGRLERAANTSISNAAELRQALRVLFVHFRRHNAKACAISLPPDFSPKPVSNVRADTAIAALWSEGERAGEAHRRAASHWVFWTLAELCSEFHVPLDLMIGVNRNVYPGGVHQGKDLYDSRVSLIQYRELFNAFPEVVFPVSVLASVTNQELVSYAWIFPNVVTCGHWWYSNTPTFIEHDLAARLEAVPRTKQIGYYSDMYKLEFALPKFNMYKRILAKVLAERFILDRGWSEERAVDLGQQILRSNVEEIFRFHEPAPTLPEEPVLNRSLAWVGSVADAVQPPTEVLPGMREFQYWPQATEAEEGEEYDLAGSSSAAMQAEVEEESSPWPLPMEVEEEIGVYESEPEAGKDAGWAPAGAPDPSASWTPSVVPEEEEIHLFEEENEPNIPITFNNPADTPKAVREVPRASGDDEFSLTLDPDPPPARQNAYSDDDLVAEVEDDEITLDFSEEAQDEDQIVLLEDFQLEDEERRE